MRISGKRSAEKVIFVFFLEKRAEAEKPLLSFLLLQKLLFYVALSAEIQNFY